MAAYDYQIRPALVQVGYKDSDIGYDPKRNMVTLQGQDFLGGNKIVNISGSTFTDRGTFDSALNQFRQRQSNVVPFPTTRVSTTQTNQTPSTPTYQPQDNRYNELMDILYQQVRNPQPVDVNAILSSPQYAAHQQAVQRSAHQATRAAQEALGSAGFGRSTALAERAQGIQNEANEYLLSQVLPQLVAQEEARRRQQLMDQMGILDVLMRERDAANRLALEEGALTGQYLGQREREALPLLQELVRLGEAWQSGTPEQQRQYHQEAEQIRSTLRSMGIDPTLYDPNLSTEERIAAIQRLGRPTLSERQLGLQQRAQEMDEMQIMAQLTGFLPDGTPTTAYQQQQLENEWRVADATGRITPYLSQLYGLPENTPTLAAKQLAIQQQQANTAAYSAQTSRMNLDLTRQRQQNEQNSQAIQAQIMSGLSQFDDADQARAWLNANAGYITQNLGANALQQFHNMIPLFYGEDTSQQQAQSAARIRQQATEMAAKDNRWLDSNQNKEALIQEYIRYLGG